MGGGEARVTWCLSGLFKINCTKVTDSKSEVAKDERETIEIPRNYRKSNKTCHK